MKTIPFADDLDLPIAAVTTRFADMGNIGSGKSYGAMKRAEGMLEAGAQIVVIDPVGVWYGLRILPNGKPSGYDLPIFGGLHGDLPLESTAGKMIADLVVDRRISAILDTSMFESDADLHRFLTDFGARFFFRKKQQRSPVHVFVEECQEAVPQNPMKEETKTLHAWQRMLKLGRNFGIGASLISQRPQDVNKKVLNLTEVLVCYQMNGSQERDRMKDWIVDKGLDVKLLEVLPTIPIGKPYVWSPRWLKVIKQVSVLKKRTADVSATPEIGDADVFEPVKLQPGEIEKLGEQIKATLERAKDSDPAELRKQLHATRAELAKLNRELVVVQGRVETKPVPVMSPEDFEHWKKVTEIAKNTVERVGNELISKLSTFVPNQKPLMMRTVQLAALPPRKYIEPIIHKRNKAVTHATEDNGKPLGKAERSILNVAASYAMCTKKKAAIMSGYAMGGGGFNNALGRLRSLGYITTGDPFSITNDGATAAGDVEPVPTGVDLYEKWMNHPELGRAEREILRVLWTANTSLTKESIAESTISERGEPYDPAGGGFANAIGRLRSLELITGKGSIQLADEFRE